MSAYPTRFLSTARYGRESGCAADPYPDRTNWVNRGGEMFDPRFAELDRLISKEDSRPNRPEHYDRQANAERHAAAMRERNAPRCPDCGVETRRKGGFAVRCPEHAKEHKRKISERWNREHIDTVRRCWRTYQRNRRGAAKGRMSEAQKHEMALAMGGQANV